MTTRPSRLRDDLLRAEDVPARALRAAETDIKRRVFRLEDRAVVALARDYRDLWRAQRDDAHELADRLGLRRIEPTRAGAEWRRLWLRAAEGRIDAMRGRIAATALRWTTRALEMGYYGRAWALDEATRPDVPIRAMRLNPYRSAQQAADLLVYEDIYDDLMLRPEFAAWRALYDTELDALIVEIRRATQTGMAAGESIDDIMRRVRDVTGLDLEWMNYRGGTALILSGTRANFNRVQMLTRTAVNKAANDGAARLYRENADVLIGYRWLAATDERTCATCRGLNGTFYRLESQFRPPAHPNCRCTIIPEIQAELAWLEGPQRTFAEWLRSNQLGDWLEEAA